MTASEFLEATSLTASHVNRDLVSETRGRILLKFMCSYGFTLLHSATALASFNLTRCECHWFLFAEKIYTPKLIASHPDVEQLNSRWEHIRSMFSSECNISLEMLAQPMDQGVIETMKRKRLNFKDTIYGVARAWTELKDTNIRSIL